MSWMRTKTTHPPRTTRRRKVLSYVCMYVCMYVVFILYVYVSTVYVCKYCTAAYSSNHLCVIQYCLFACNVCMYVRSVCNVCKY